MNKNKRTERIGLKQLENRNKKGITLIALVITVVILIILATVTLNVVLGEGGLIQRAQEAKALTEQAALEEQQGLNDLMSEMDNIMEEDQTPSEEETMTIEEAKPNPGEDGPKLESITSITDDLGNKIKVPEGFHLDQDSGTKVEEGIVIEDDNGNQFVWIPVGEYNVSTSINSSGKLTNELTRRTFTSTGSTPVSGDDVIETYYYGEGDSRSVAKDQIEAFKTSSNTNKGFYIGRYEQGEGNVCKAGVEPYINITRDEAKAQAEAMYSGNEFITSQLISSYAWDTALNFICQTNGEGYLLATTTDSAYGNINRGSRTQTGEYEADNYSNIYDMLGNCCEGTTEYSSSVTGSWVVRGGYTRSDTYAAARHGNSKNGSSDTTSFRLQLYINLES